MAKKLITLNNMEQHICEGKFYLEEGMIITPGVLDYLTEKMIEKVPAACCQREDSFKKDIENVSKKLNQVEREESLEEMTRRILKRDYNLEDEQMINMITKAIRGVMK